MFWIQMLQEGPKNELFFVAILQFFLKAEQWSDYVKSQEEILRELKKN